MILHKVARSPFDSTALQRCLRRISDQDAILLLQDAVYAAFSDNEVTEALRALPQVYLLKDDVDARGITNRLYNAKLVGYPEFVQLCAQYNKVISW